ncbi:ATP-binding protein [Candidatus Peregrinibacteria bacterium]|jgi:anti-sigma regulatory factor (Ser/Thr protein kinase)|nr:ATP-binding protein [Candidatus Peregrinibacteria bacterium]
MNTPLPHSQNPETTKITITIPTHAYFISGIRDFTMSLVKNMTGFSEKWAYRFQAVIDELCNNGIEHGSQKGEDIIISFITSQDTLTLAVEDNGTSPTAKNANQMKELLKQKLDEQAQNTMGAFSIRGRGLSQIVYSWSDSLEFFDRIQGGLKVQITKNIKNEGATET